MVDSIKCTALLQRAYDGYKNGEPIVTSSGFDLCDDELKWLETANYIEIVKPYTHGAQYQITSHGIKFLSQ